MVALHAVSTLAKDLAFLPSRPRKPPAEEGSVRMPGILF